jgi:hypothetical protein
MRSSVSVVVVERDAAFLDEFGSFAQEIWVGERLVGE